MLNILMKNQTLLNTYFEHTWKSNIDQYEFSGWALINKVKDAGSVLDVGCGYNPFKGKIPNLTGIDPANDAADVRCSIEDFCPDEYYDVAFCLGSINFGTVDDIEAQIAKVVSWLKPTARIYWRCNPGRADHNNDKCGEIPFYPWSIEEQIRLAIKFGFNLKECRWDSGRRIYAEWSR
jgi:hypothetical protein